MKVCKKAILTSSVVMSVILVTRAIHTNKFVSYESRKAEIEKKYYANTGGRVIKPESGQGEIIIYNAQQRIPEETIKDIAEHITLLLAMRVSVRKGDPVGLESLDDKLKELNGSAAIFLVDNPTHPLSLVAYENGWGVVNASLLAHSPADKIRERTEKELIRTLCLICGIATNAGASSLMLPVRDVNDLDTCELPSERGSSMITRPLHKYMLNFGVMPVTVSTYRKACSDGWAPKPKDKDQEALWNKYKGKSIKQDE